MNKNPRWLLGEIELWRNEGIVSVEQAQLLRDRYAQPPAGSWGKVIFSALGAIIFGLGIVLLLAYNWEGMHRLTKLAFILGAVVLAHGLGIWLRTPGSAHPKIGESLHLLGTMLFGAGIWLIAQIYHIDEHYPNAFLVWSLGALLLGWVIPSMAHTLLAMALLAVWHSFEVFQFHYANHWAIWLIALGILPQAWLRRSSTTLLFSSALLAFTYATAVLGLDTGTGDWVLAVLLAIAASCIIASRIAVGSSFPGAMSPLRIVGFLLYAALLFLLSFDDFAGDVYEPQMQLSLLEWIYFLLPIVVVATALAVLVLRYPQAIANKLDRLELGMVLCVLIVALLLSFGILVSPQVSWLFFSLLFLVHSLLLIWRGTQQLRWQSAALGSVMLSAFVFARFLDLFQSLLMRSLAFLILGAALFAVGFYYSSQKQRQGGH